MSIRNFIKHMKGYQDFSILIGAFVALLILSTIISQIQKIGCDQYCQQIAQENYNRGFQAGESKGLNEGYNRGYNECKQLYESKYSECLKLLNSTNITLQSCQKELEVCLFQLNKTVELDALINEYIIAPKNITVKQLFITFGITIGITIALIEITVKFIFKQGRAEEIVRTIFLIFSIVLVVLTFIEILIKLAYFFLS